MNKEEKVIEIRNRKYYVNQLQQENKQLKEINEEHKKLNGELRETINKAIEHISKEFLCYDNESDEYIQGLKAIEILKGDSNE